MITEMVAAYAPVLVVGATRIHHRAKSIGFPGLATILLLAVILAGVGVIGTRRRSRTWQRDPERSGDWPPRPSGRGPIEDRDLPPWP